MRKLYIICLLALFCNELLSCDQVQNIDCENATIIDEYLFQQMYCMDGCNSEGAPGLFQKADLGCESSPFPTVWYTLDNRNMTRFLTIEINSSTLSNPMISIYEGSCDNNEILVCNQGYNGMVALRNVKIFSGINYKIGVSSSDGETGDFEVCFYVEEDPNLCNKESDLEVMNTSMGSPKHGPFKPGESVELCYTINGFQNVSCNYLHAIVPIFGNGWDPSSFDAQGQPIKITKELVTQGKTSFDHSDPYCEGDPAGDWLWYGASSVKYNLNSQNTLGLNSSDMLPPAWVFLNSFDPSCFVFDDACCDNPTSDPNQGYGDDDYPTCFDNPDQEWQICFELVANVNPDCIQSSDCSIGMKSISDGETGTFTDNDCANDNINFLDFRVECCSSPVINSSERNIELCIDEPLSINLESDDPKVNYYYFLENSNLPVVLEKGTSEINMNFDTDGLHLIEVYATNGCLSDPLVIEVQVSELESVAIVQDQIACEGEEVVLELEYLAGTNTVAPLIEWSTNDSGEIISTDSSTREVSAKVAVGGCVEEVSFEIEWAIQPEFDLPESYFLDCQQTEIMVEAQGIDLATQQTQWLYNEEVIQTDATELMLSQGGTYILEVMDLNSGCSSLDSVLIIENPSSLQTQLNIKDEIEIELGQSFQIELVHNQKEEDILNIIWTHDGTLSCNDCLNPTATPQNDLIYLVVIQDIYGCESSHEIIVRVLESQEPEQKEATGAVYIPNVFSPEATGENQYFQIYADSQVVNIENLAIYDRWGMIVHEIENAPVGDTRVLWDGSVNGNPLDGGVYLFMLNVKLEDGTIQQYSGNLTLLR